MAWVPSSLTHLVGIGVGHRLAPARLPGVVHEDRQAAELVDDPGDHRLVGLGVVDRRADGDRPAAELLDLGDDLGGGVGVLAVVHGDVGAVLGEGEADGPPDPPAPTGHQRDTTIERHGRASCSRAHSRPPPADGGGRGWE